MITICGCGGRKPLNTPQLWREGLTQARRLENSTGWFLPRKEYSRKSWSPGRRLRLPQPQRPGAPTCEAAARGARRTAKGPLGLPGGTGLRASLQSRRNWGNSSKLGSTPPPGAIPREGAGTRPAEPFEKGHGCPRTAASVPKVGGTPHLGSGTRELRVLQYPVACTRPATYSFPSARWRRGSAAEGAS